MSCRMRMSYFEGFRNRKETTADRPRPSRISFDPRHLELGHGPAVRVGPAPLCDFQSFSLWQRDREARRPTA